MMYTKIIKYVIAIVCVALILVFQQIQINKIEKIESAYLELSENVIRYQSQKSLDYEDINIGNVINNIKWL